MSNIRNLLVESSDNVEVLTEDTQNGKQLYIEGVFAQANVKNGNGRIYERKIMEQAVHKYNTDYTSKNRALGELNHPDRPFADPAEAAIRIVRMEMNGDNVEGKAIVLNTPKGQIVKGLLEGGFALGVSTRGLGSLKEANGLKYVQDDFMMTAVDTVDNPSAPDAYVQGIMESTQWTLSESTGVWVPVVNEHESEQVNEQLFLEKLETLLKRK